MKNSSINKLKILHIAPINYKKASGPSSSVINLAKAQVKLGHKIAILPSIPSSFPSISIPKKITLIKGPKKRHLNPWRISAKWIGKIEKDFVKPDIINFHDTYIPFHIAFARLCSKNNWRYTITPRGGLGELAQRIKFYKKYPANIFFFKKYIKNASIVHALSEIESNDIKNKFKHTPTEIISNGIDKDLLNISNEIKNSNKSNFKKKIKIGFVGRIDIYHKGIDLLFEALLKFKNNHNSTLFELIIIGPYHSKKDKKYVESFIKRFSLNKTIILKGKLFGHKKWLELSNFDIFVHTSRFEGIPNSVLEAMAFGKPCLVTEGTNLASLIKKNNCGWSSQTSIESIYDQLSYLSLEGKNDILQFGFNAKKYIKNNHLMDNIAKKYITVYESLLKNY